MGFTMPAVLSLRPAQSNPNLGSNSGKLLFREPLGIHRYSRLRSIPNFFPSSAFVTDSMLFLQSQITEYFFVHRGYAQLPNFRPVVFRGMIEDGYPYNR